MGMQQKPVQKMFLGAQAKPTKAEARSHRPQ